MAVAKWFLKLNATTPLGEAAEVVLESRARAVLHYLNLLANRRHEHPEQVHQLRVASRRFGAALAIFKKSLGAGDYRKLRKLTRQLRRTAGVTRDLDVQREILAKRLKTMSSAGSALTAECDAMLVRKRRLAYRQLVRRVRTATRKFPESVKHAVSRIQAPSSAEKRKPQTLGHMARKTLRRRLKRLHAAGRKDPQDPNNLHRVRIAAKRLRYAMEVFAGCFTLGFRQGPYRLVEQIQEELGGINDLRNLIQTARDLHHELQPAGPGSDRSVHARALQEFASGLQVELQTLQVRFIRSWNPHAWQRFNRRLKELMDRPVPRSRVRERHDSKL